MSIRTNEITKLSQEILSRIARLQKETENKFIKADIQLRIVPILGEDTLPSFSGGTISHITGSSLDVSFKNEQDYKLTVHFFGETFGLTLEGGFQLINYTMDKMDQTDFLKGLAELYNTKYKDYAQMRKAMFEFSLRFRP